jgi:hypothetical protein
LKLNGRQNSAWLALDKATIKPKEKDINEFYDPSAQVKIHNLVPMKTLNDNVMMLKEASRMVKRNAHNAVENNMN